MTLKITKVATLMLFLTVPGIINAQFNTIRKKEFTGYEILTQTIQTDFKTDNQKVDTVNPTSSRIDSPDVDTLEINPAWYVKVAVRKKHLADAPGVSKARKVEQARKVTDLTEQRVANLPELNVPNLLAEIRRNGIKHEKIVLAQAILETGWFKSSVCRNKHNLFGLTNPKTGQYYEFNHWTESVKAYYTKVQYRYRQKNGGIKGAVDYLLWLRDIGYAEDKGRSGH